MLRIGVTGGIGSGKTMVCKIFELLKVPVFYADAAAKTAMQTDNSLVSGIIKAFGEKSYSSEGIPNRLYIASIVFGDDEALKQLNALVHPAVFRAFDEWVLLQKKALYVVKEAALLFESGSYKDCKYSVLVSSPLETRLLRVMKRDRISEEQVMARISKQMPEEEKAKMTDLTIYNNEKELIIPQVLKLHQKFLAEV